MAPATAPDRLRRAPGAVGTATVHRPWTGGGVTCPSACRSRCHVARTLRPVGGRPRRAPQRSDDVAVPGAPGLAAQKKSLRASEQDATVRAARRAEMAACDPAHLVFVDERGTHTALTRL